METAVIAAEPPELKENLIQGMERRLVSRLLTYWRDLREDRLFPLVSEVRSDDIPDLWANCFVLSVTGDPDGAVFRRIGDALIELGGDLTDRAVSDAPASGLLGVSTVYFGEVLAKGAPVSRGGAFEDADGATVKFRSILLPMSDAGDRIDQILGAISWLRELPRADQPD